MEDKKRGFFSKNSYKIIAIAVVLALVISLIPIFMISSYNYPSRDDYFLGSNVYKSHDTLFDTVGSAFDRAKIAYNTWQGLFTVNFILALMPASFGSQYYAITTFASILLLIATTFYFAYQLLVKLLKVEKTKYLIITSLITLLSIQFLPSPVQGFFWYASVGTYTVSYSLMIFLFGLILSYIVSDKEGGLKKYLAPLVIFSFLVSGCNYIVVLFSLLFLISIMIYMISSKNKKYIAIGVCIAIMLIGFVISIVAPGNTVRGIDFEKMSPILSVLISFPAAMRSVLEIFNKLPVLIGLLILMPLLLKSINLIGKEFKFKHPIIIFLISWTLYSATFTPTYYAMQGAGLGRVENIRMFILLWMVLINIYYFIGYFKRKLEETVEDNSVDKKSFYSVVNEYTRKYKTIFTVILFIFFIASMYSVDLEKMTSTSATLSLVNGEAAQYHKQQLKRESLYLSDEKDVVVDKLSVKPYVLFFWDIEESEDGRYEHMEIYYDKNSIIIRD